MSDQLGMIGYMVNVQYLSLLSMLRLVVESVLFRARLKRNTSIQNCLSKIRSNEDSSKSIHYYRDGRGE